MSNVVVQRNVEEVFFIIFNQLLEQSDANIEGVLNLKKIITNYSLSKEKIQFLLPAFPCKTNNLDKVTGCDPDLGEYLVLKKFVKAIRDIQSVYEPGVIFYIFSDYHTFSEYISVDLDRHYSYANGLRDMVESLNCDDSLKIVNFEDFEDFKLLEAQEYSRALLLKYGDKDYINNFESLKLRNNKTNDTYLGLKKFMSKDQKYILAEFSDKERRKRLSQIAKGMMVQGAALDKFLLRKFGNCIRLSIHRHPMTGEKYSLNLFENYPFRTPWHNTVMFDSLSGKYVVDSFINNKNRYLAIPVVFKGKIWCLLKLSINMTSIEQPQRSIKATLYREKAGLVLDCGNLDLSIFSLSHKELSNLIKEFNSVTLRGFKKFQNRLDLESWYDRFGPLVPYKSGNINSISFCNNSYLSGIKSPVLLSWNLKWPLSYLDGNHGKYNYADITPGHFVIYAYKNKSLKQEFLTVDTALAVLRMHGKEREEFRKLTLRYPLLDGNLNYKYISHPVLMQCPLTHQDIIRWIPCNGETLSLQTSSSSEMDIQAFPEFHNESSLTQKLDEICMDDQIQISHHLMEGDVLIVNNHTTLQSIPKLSNQSELWCASLQPKSINSPWKPHNIVKLDQLG
ncbi:L-tyrosine/L-tryptophan isonitrile synthase family protein [Microbulbifer sp. GL-2]|uniref:L-tyrosine/L-tryptophan isonitrile synthase family protein n=1 Tax=Microbulbifer sp. GL-2 TaxID=2591606 RepID=UPI001164B981|nr:L-tyrosine/L-tryptophan isonitrile synthase family protein [Microbulbifer sp. GL-2]BBM04011.1 hypothetical protein GL2_40850 [Microbulbifer sp. GL-2]